jgi:hypothetical protein
MEGRDGVDHRRSSARRDWRSRHPLGYARRSRARRDRRPVGRRGVQHRPPSWTKHTWPGGRSRSTDATPASNDRLPQRSPVAGRTQASNPPSVLFGRSTRTSNPEPSRSGRVRPGREPVVEAILRAFCTRRSAVRTTPGSTSHEPAVGIEPTAFALRVRPFSSPKCCLVPEQVLRLPDRLYSPLSPYRITLFPGNIRATAD